MEISTTYRIAVANKGGSFEGVTDVPESVWDYATSEFSELIQIGKCEHPVLSHIRNNKLKEFINVEDEVVYYDIYPTYESDQIVFFGNPLDEEDEEKFNDEVVGYFSSLALTDACRKGKTNRTQIKDLLVGIFKVVTEKVIADVKFESSHIANLEWEEN